MNTIYKLVALILFSASFAVAQNVDFEKANFQSNKTTIIYEKNYFISFNAKPMVY